MKNYFIAIQCKDINGKEWAFVKKVNPFMNLTSVLQCDDVIAANIADSKRMAEKMVDTWNGLSKERGVYAFN